MSHFVALLLFQSFCCIACAGDIPAEEFLASARLEADIKVVSRSRQGMEQIITFIDSRPDIFPAATVTKKDLSTRGERLIVWHTWQAFLDHLLTLDSIGQTYDQIHQQAEGPDKERAFTVSFACFLAQYRFALDLIDRFERDPALHVILNEPVPELGLGKGTYAKLKSRFLNIMRGTEFARLAVLYRFYDKEPENPLTRGIDQDSALIWQAGRGKGPELTAKNAGRIVQDLGFTTWLPVQKSVAQMMGKIKLWRPDNTLITEEQIKAMLTKLEPGDVLLERREWFMTNAGIPGFWPHAALYVGTTLQREQFFNEPQVKQWVQAQGEPSGNFEMLLRNRYPEPYLQSLTPQDHQHLPRVIEAIAKGVSFTTLEHSAAADSLAVLRPNLSKQAKARAIMRAFHYSGRPYDFNFDFRTDAELVCSELIYKAYEPSPGLKGLQLPTIEVLGRPLTPPNEIARLFDTEYGSGQEQFSFVLFLDGHERQGRALKEDAAEFRKSFQRPKWHILTQETALAD